MLHVCKETDHSDDRICHIKHNPRNSRPRPMKIITSRSLLLAFRRECRERFPIENLACIWGHREGDEVHIERIVPLPHDADEHQANYDTRHITASKIKALKAGMEWLGTIHSHCTTRKASACHHLSPADVETAIDNGEIVSGICYVFMDGTRTEIHWHQPVPLPTVQYL